MLNSDLVPDPVQDNPSSARAVLTICRTFDAIANAYKDLSTRVHNTVISPLNKFLETDYERIGEAKEEFQNADKVLEQAMTR